MTRCDDVRFRYTATLWDVAEHESADSATWDRLKLEAKLVYGRDWERKLAADLADALRIVHRSMGEGVA